MKNIKPRIKHINFVATNASFVDESVVTFYFRNVNIKNNVNSVRTAIWFNLYNARIALLVKNNG